jgi:hypothetical protein
MKLSKAVIWFSLVVAALVLVAAATGVFSQTSGAHITFVTRLYPRHERRADPAVVGRIIPYTLAGRFPDEFAGVTTLVTQAFDLGMLVPLLTSTGILLLGVRHGDTSLPE